MWIDIAKNIDGKDGIYEVGGVETPVRVEEAVAGTAFVRIRLFAPAANEHFVLTGYVPQMQTGLDDVKSEFVIRQTTGDWLLRFGHESIGG